MAADDQNDPFEWDEDRVVQELCTQNRSWKPTASRQPLDPTALEAKIRERGVDGQSLLTYSDVFGLPTFWSFLGVKKFPHQLLLTEAISQLRRASPGYGEWKRRQPAEAQQSDAGDDPPAKSERLAWASPGLSTRGTLDTLVPSEHKQAPTLQSPAQGFVGDGHVQDADQIRPATSQSAVPCQGVLSPALSPIAEPDHTNSETPQAQLEHLALPKPSGDSTPQEGPPPKKRRIAPTILSAEPTRVHPSFIPTEADRFLMPTVDEPENTGPFLAPAMEKSSHIEPLLDYLGPDARSREEIVGPTTTTTENLETEFSYSYFNRAPGRQAQVAAALKRFLRSNEPVVPPEPNAHVEDEESLLPVFGESDDEISYDSETWREIQDEEEERRKMEAQKKDYLSKEMVREIVLKVITDLEARWRVEKQPKEDRKAWKEWQRVRRMPDRQAYIGGKKRYRDELEVRINTLMKEFIGTQYTPHDRLENMATGNLELSVFARMHQNWLISMLESPRPPAKPEALPRPAPIRKRVRDKVEDGEELLSSSESEGMNEFIEYDGIGLADDKMDLDPASPPKEAEGINMEVEVATTETILADAETNVAGLQTGLVDQEMVGADQGYDDDVSAPPTTEFAQERGADELPTVQPTPTKSKPERGTILTIPQRPIVPSGVQIIEIPDTPPPLVPLDENPGFNDFASLEKIVEIGKEHWQNIKDSERLLVVVLYEWSDAKKDRIYKAVMDGDCNTVWRLYLEPVVEAEDPESAAPVHSVELNLGQLFDIYISATTARLEKPTMKRLTWQRLKGYRSEKFPAFFEHLKKVIVLLKTGQPPTPRKRISIKKVPPKAPISCGSLVEEEETPESQDPADALVTISDEEEDSSGSNPTPTPTTKKKKKKPLVLNKEAKSIRITHVEQNKEFDRRRRRLQEELAVGILPADKSRLIVNETKDDDQALIFINDMIGSRIKDHQIEGVRFMWNQLVVGDRVVANSNVQNRQGQGCLLAHTMGLGKTMQVITLLVVIAEAAASDDPSVRSQIPEGLRESKTLILCPSGLVDNWVDEFMLWAPEDLLGPLRKLSSSVPTEERPSMIKAWASNGGVLITGYTLFTKLVTEPELKDLLIKAPNIVVGDEAHKLKNPNSQQHQATQLFRTGSRIAMTGSPLTNNVMDYYAMINWVAPNYLADIKEFKQCFANPIGEGLYADSDPPSKRKARKLLHALKEIVDPKVHRKDVQVLFSELPQKKEFIITLPLTELQRSLYEAYIQAIRDPRIADKITGQARIWSLIARLSLVLAHPQVFRTAATSPKNQAQRTAKAAKSVEAEEDGVELPEDILNELLAVVSLQELGELGHSYKVLALLKILEECQEVGDKVLVFSHSIATLDFLEDLFKQRMVPFQRLDGATPIEERQSLVKRFNDTDTSVYLISTKAGGVGLNIYGANRVVIFDFRYTPADEQQAIGRAYRLGQTKPVFVYWLVVGGTFEDDLHNHSVFKSQLASRVVDKKNPDPWSRRNLKTYFMMPRELEHTDLTNSFGHDTVLDALLKSADVGPQIRKITSNETFEKEETFELSAEDKLEAKKDIELMRLRSHNPQEYEREVERRRIATSMAAQSGYQQAVASVAPSQVNEALHRLPPTLPNVHSLNVPLPTAQPEGTILNSSELLPIAAVGTHFAQGSNIPLPAAPHMPPQSISPNPDSQASQPRNSPATPNAIYEFSALMKFYAKLPPEKKSIAKHPHEVQNSFLDALERSKMDRVVISDSMTRLHKLTNNERFAEAMLSGYIKPDSNKAWLFVELKKKKEALKELSDAQFNSLVWEQKARSSPQQPRAHSSPNIKIEGQKTKKGPGGASKARRGPEDRRLGDSADFPLALD